MCSGPGQLKAPVACAADSEQLDPDVAEEQAKMKVCPRAYWSSNQCAGYVLVRVVLQCSASVAAAEGREAVISARAPIDEP